MNLSFRDYLKEGIVLVLFLLFLALFFVKDPYSALALSWDIPVDFMNINTIFLSIVLEALPFILIGVFASSLIQSFVSEDLLRRVLPKRAIVAMLPATLLGLLFPICECAIIPVVRRLLKKGLPLHLGIVLMVTIPIINPIVMLSTSYAFQGLPHVIYARFGVALLVALTIGALVYLLFDGAKVLKRETTITPHHHGHTEKKWVSTLQHAADEFFDTGKFLIFGAFLASLFQTMLDREVLSTIGTSEVFAPLSMMGLAYVLSLCSEADAFVAASFANTFQSSSLVAFLVLGPMIDLKNTMMMFAYFRKRFVIFFVLVTFLVVYAYVHVLDIWMR